MLEIHFKNCKEANTNFYRSQRAFVSESRRFSRLIFRQIMSIERNYIFVNMSFRDKSPLSLCAVLQFLLPTSNKLLFFQSFVFYSSFISVYASEAIKFKQVWAGNKSKLL